MNVEWARHSEKKLRAPFLPASDNTSEALAALQAANLHYRSAAWPAPFNATKHCLHKGGARDLSWIPDNSVHLVVTSPPYWTLKKYEERGGQLGEIIEYESFLEELDRVWRGGGRGLVEGGGIFFVVGEVCFPSNG